MSVLSDLKVIDGEGGGRRHITFPVRPMLASGGGFRTVVGEEVEVEFVIGVFHFVDLFEAEVLVEFHRCLGIFYPQPVRVLAMFNVVVAVRIHCMVELVLGGVGRHGGGRVGE